MIQFILSTLGKYLLQDLPVIVVSLISMWCVISIYLPVKKKRKWFVLFLIEGFEHLVMPMILFFILLQTDSYKSALLFHLAILTFLFGFIGYFVVGASSKKDWLGVFAVAVFTYFFVFIYPFLLIFAQINTPIIGWWWLLGTLIFFIGFYFVMKNKNSS